MYKIQTAQPQAIVRVTNTLKSLDRVCRVRPTDPSLLEAAEHYYARVQEASVPRPGSVLDRLNETSDAWIRATARRHPRVAFHGCASYLAVRDNALLTSLVVFLRGISEIQVNEGMKDRDVLMAYLLWRHGVLSNEGEVYTAPLDPMMIQMMEGWNIDTNDQA